MTIGERIVTEDRTYEIMDINADADIVILQMTMHTSGRSENVVKSMRQVAHLRAEVEGFGPEDYED